MTNRQQDIYDYIKNFIEKNQYSPTVREITEGLDIKSVSTVHKQLGKMKEKGYINFVKSSPRTLRIIA